MTALYVASRNGYVEVVHILLQKGVHIDVQKDVSWTFSPATDRALKLYVSQEHVLKYSYFIQVKYLEV